MLWMITLAFSSLSSAFCNIVSHNQNEIELVWSSGSTVDAKARQQELHIGNGVTEEISVEVDNDNLHNIDRSSLILDGVVNSSPFIKHIKTLDCSNDVWKGENIKQCISWALSEIISFAERVPKQISAQIYFSFVKRRGNVVTRCSYNIMISLQSFDCFCFILHTAGDVITKLDSAVFSWNKCIFMSSLFFPIVFDAQTTTLLNMLFSRVLVQYRYIEQISFVVALR